MSHFCTASRVHDKTRLPLAKDRDGPAGGGLYTVAAAKDRKNVLTLLQAETTMVVFAAPAGNPGGE